MHQVQSMAYMGNVPWHGLGEKLQRGESVDVWKKKAGMDWTIQAAPVEYRGGDPAHGDLHSFPGQRVLFRSDTRRPLAVVSNRFEVVQPSEVLEFYQDLVELGGFELETAGVLREGRKLWALARTGHTATLRGRDVVNGYLLLATACDGTLATTATFTSIRVVCNNTLAVALRGAPGAVKVPHRTKFNQDAVKQRLGVTVSSWDRFVSKLHGLSEQAVDEESARDLLQRVMTYPLPGGHQPAVNRRAVDTVLDLFAGRARGAGLASSQGTAWGLLNSLTEYVDHHRRARTADLRRDAAWFGVGAQLKARAWEEFSNLTD